MNCYYHPDRISVAQCVVCGKELCSECVIIKEGQNYCKECLGTGEAHVGAGKILVPALACGVLAGILSVTPLISALNCIFCLWIIIGGGLAVYLVKRFNKITGKISTGMSLLTGALTGFVASFIMVASLVIIEDFTSIMDEAMRSPEVQEALKDAGMAAGDIAGVLLALVAVIVVVAFTLFGALGGLISNEITK